ncbi:MAG: hypothetical protein ABFS41_15115, partial [Myxococcota bacterium]
PRTVEGEDFDPTRRELCPDGACVGVIGSNGRCAECGAASSHAADAVADAAAATEEAAQDAMDEMAGSGEAAAAAAAGSDPVAACRALAEKGAWGEALAVCEKAHELMPDDMALEHAVQQARAAAEQ